VGGRALVVPFGSGAAAHLHFMEAAAAQLDVRWTGPSSRRGKVTDVILSIAEITEIERAYALGAPTLGRAAAGLLARWQMPLRDIETFLRLAFLSWYRQNEPAWLTGLANGSWCRRPR
jgi:hypothetical protein